MTRVRVRLFTDQQTLLATYWAPTPPRSGEFINHDDDIYRVESVLWSGIPDSPTANVHITGGLP